jgi:hypothetical protein
LKNWDFDRAGTKVFVPLIPIGQALDHPSASTLCNPLAVGFRSMARTLP